MPRDPDECETCWIMGETCPYHLGWADGWDACAEATASIKPVDPRPNLQIAS